MERFTKSVRIHSKRRFCSTDGLLIQFPKLFSLTICIIKCCIPYGSLCVKWCTTHPTILCFPCVNLILVGAIYHLIHTFIHCLHVQGRDRFGQLLSDNICGSNNASSSDRPQEMLSNALRNFGGAYIDEIQSDSEKKKPTKEKLKQIVGHYSKTIRGLQKEVEDLECLFSVFMTANTEDSLFAHCDKMDPAALNRLWIFFSKYTAVDEVSEEWHMKRIYNLDAKLGSKRAHEYLFSLLMKGAHAVYNRHDRLPYVPESVRNETKDYWSKAIDKATQSPLSQSKGRARKSTSTILSNASPLTTLAKHVSRLPESEFKDDDANVFKSRLVFEDAIITAIANKKEEIQKQANEKMEMFATEYKKKYDTKKYMNSFGQRVTKHLKKGGKSKLIAPVSMAQRIKKHERKETIGTKRPLDVKPKHERKAKRKKVDMTTNASHEHYVPAQQQQAHYVPQQQQQAHYVPQQGHSIQSTPQQQQAQQLSINSNYAQTDDNVWRNDPCFAIWMAVSDLQGLVPIFTNWLNRPPFCRRDANDPRIATQFGEFLITQAPCAQDLMNKYMKQRNKWPANHPFFTMVNQPLNQNQSTQLNQNQSTQKQ
eukprot:750713_1